MTLFIRLFASAVKSKKTAASAGKNVKPEKQKFMSGGQVRKLDLNDAVIYNGETWFYTEKNGVKGITNTSQGAWGSNYPFIALSKLDVENDLTDMYGKKVKFSLGGGVDEYINIDKMNPKQYEIVTNFNTLKSLAKNGLIELHEKTGLRYKNYESKDK